MQILPKSLNSQNTIRKSDFIHWVVQILISLNSEQPKKSLIFYNCTHNDPLKLWNLIQGIRVITASITSVRDLLILLQECLMYQFKSVLPFTRRENKKSPRALLKGKVHPFTPCQIFQWGWDYTCLVLHCTRTLAEIRLPIVMLSKAFQGFPKFIFIFFSFFFLEVHTYCPISGLAKEYIWENTQKALV